MIFSSALLLVMASAAARAQELLPAPLTLEPAKAAAPAADMAPASPAPPPGLSHWITYTKPDCCGPVGGNGPIGYELFLRGGLSLPVEGKNFGHVLDVGWEVEGGARSLFFNPAMDRDWSIDFGISNILNRGQHSDRKFPYTIFNVDAIGQVTGTSTVQVSVRELNRTNVSLGLGRDWYLVGNARACDCTHWRFGVDAGGRLGTAKIEFYELSHRTDTITSMYAGLHTDLEIPRGCCTFLIGARAEWDYTWTDLLQDRNNGELQDVNLMLTFGVRF